MRVKIAVLETYPKTIIEDIDQLVEMTGLRYTLPLDKLTILKDNIS